MYWLDYSAAKLSGTTIKAAGYGGVIRYIDSPDRLRTKHTNKAEYDSLVAAGLKVWLVMQNTTTDADGGWNAGFVNAQRALAGAQMLGYSGPIFFTNDRTTVPNADTWRAYLDGAASVLGIARVGAYGFANAIELAVGHATYFWQSGRRTDLRPHSHLWQDNNTQVTVGGITCDRNLVLKEILEEEDVSQADVEAGLKAFFWGIRYEGNRNPVDMWAETVRQSFGANAKLDGLAAAVAAIHVDPNITKDELTRIIDEATPNAADVAAALEPLVVAKLTDNLKTVLTDVLGDDNADQAAEILRQLAEKLAA